MNSDDNNQSINILLVEDNMGDVFLISQCLKQSDILYQLHRVEDGEEATQFLTQTSTYSNAPRPDLILLDLNLPRMDGRELLANLKRNPLFQTIPVIILTTSSAPNDVSQAYRLNANSYVVKPSTLEGFRRAMESIGIFWLQHSQLPNM